MASSAYPYSTIAMKFEAILFDCDGVLVDSEPLTNGVLCTMFNEAGWAISPEECMATFIGKTVRMVGYYVCRKWVTTSKGDLMNFGTMTDVDGHFFDTVHFPPSLKAYAFQGKGCYIVLGKVVDDFGFASLEVSKMVKLPFVKDGRY